jgi:hypothetical protein
MCIPLQIHRSPLLQKDFSIVEEQHHIPHSRKLDDLRGAHVNVLRVGHDLHADDVERAVGDLH